MKIAVSGTGYVGLVTGVCLAEHGHSVCCVDIDERKIELMRQGISPIYEEGLSELMEKNKERLTFTTDYTKAYRDAEVIFIGVGTPEKKDGSANLTYVYEAARQIARAAERDCVVVVKSTVPIGTNDKIEKLIRREQGAGIQIAVVSNPEFLAQGTAVRDTLHASRIVIGAEEDFAKEIMLRVYEKFDAPKLVTDRKSAEMVKYASNDFLALKISYINEIANLCELVGANIEDVTAGMGFDTRIGNQFLKAGIGYGGSCFPKDTKALHWLANSYDYEMKTVKAAIEVNENQKLKMIRKARRYYEDFAGVKVAALGLTFKPGTDDLREAPSLVNLPILLEEGAVLQAWDPIGEAGYRKLYPSEIHYCETIEEALCGAELCLIFTEWREIQEIRPELFVKQMKRPIIIDGRNCYPTESFKGSGAIYESMGRETVGKEA